MLKQHLMAPVKNALKYGLVRSGCFTRPTFIIAGAQKAGTTGLYFMLAQHPNIVPPLRKEVHFFDGSLVPYPDFNRYHCYFPAPWQLGQGQLTFEASPSYLYHPECAERIYNYSADMKIVLILRNPVERAYSAWNMYRNFCFSQSPRLLSLSEERSFENSIKDELLIIENVSWDNDRRSYVKRGIYCEQIKKYFQYFDKKSVHIINYSEFSSHPESTMKNVCNFLDINSSFNFKVEKGNVSNYEKKIDGKAFGLLSDFYSSHNHDLYDLLGVDFGW